MKKELITYEVTGTFSVQFQAENEEKAFEIADDLSMHWNPYYDENSEGEIVVGWNSKRPCACLRR